MSLPALRRGWFRRLRPGEEDLLAAHLMRLSPSDRQRRFLHAVSDAYLREHATRISRPSYHIDGWFTDGTLRGVVEVATGGTIAEAALSVEAPWRNRGIGRAMLAHAVDLARRAGCRSLTVFTTADNHAMLRVARALGARLSFGSWAVVGEIDAPSISVAELYLDSLAEQAEMAVELGTAMLSIFDLWHEGAPPGSNIDCTEHGARLPV